MRFLLYLFIICLPCVSYSQTLTTSNQPELHSSIKWAEGLTWEQVKEKAKKENKYIFLDVFATWCGPCKLMDKEVYSDKTVGDYFNQRFISVKVQTDQTKKDNEQVKSWYKDAEAIVKQYRVEGYPSFIFLSPSGNIVHKEEAYKSVSELISMAETAIKPGKVYDDPFAEYEELAKEYKKGIKKTEKMPYMITTALRLGDSDLAKKILKEFIDYCLTLTPEQRYTKENIEFWASLSPASTMRMFQFFYKDGDKIDKVMKVKGYAEMIVDIAITNEIVNPFLMDESGGNTNMVGAILTGPGLQSNYSEANWQELYKRIREKYNEDYAKRNVLDARIQWYVRNKNIPAQNKYWLLRNKKYPPPSDFRVNNIGGTINAMTWNIFLHSTNKRQIKGAIMWQKKLIEQFPNWPAALDTYANLLYKVNRKEEAIQWQEKAVSKTIISSRNRNFVEVANQMRRNEPTYLLYGAEWEGINTINWEGVKVQKVFFFKDEDKKVVTKLTVKNQRTGESKLSDEKGMVSIEVAKGDVIEMSAPGYLNEKIVVNKEFSTSIIVLKKNK